MSAQNNDMLGHDKFQIMMLLNSYYRFIIKNELLLEQDPIATLVVVLFNWYRLFLMLLKCLLENFNITYYASF